MTPTHRGKFEPLEVIVEGVTYRLFGVTHVHRAEPLYRKEMEKYALPGDFWLCEQNVDRVLPRICGAISMPDHTVAPASYFFSRGVNLGLLSPALLALLGYYNLFPQRAFWETIGGLDDIKPKEGLSSLPAPKPSLRKIMRQRRSAYQAEFMRAYAKGKNKNVVVGVGHVKEVAFYLHQPTEEEFIYRQAQQHAALAEQEPQELKRIIEGHNEAEGLLLALGSLLGVQPYLWAAFGIGKYFSP